LRLGSVLSFHGLDRHLEGSFFGQVAADESGGMDEDAVGDLRNFGEFLTQKALVR